MKTILVAGGAGFIGANFVHYLLATYPEYQVVVYDKLTYAGNLNNLLDANENPNYKFVRGDIADRATVSQVVQASQIDTIVNFAAETHVDRSILTPDAFVRTNLNGTHTLLDVAREFGLERYVQVSTDEVYGSIPEGAFKETDPLQPNSPYSASKAGGDLMVRAYYETYGLNASITRGSNTYGPYQYPEKVLPLFITNALEDKPLPLYGDGKQVRDWLYVRDHAAGIATVMHKGRPGEAYNIGGGNERQNIDVTQQVLALVGKPETLITPVRDRAGHDRRYALDCTKAHALGWQPQTDFEAGLAETVEWYSRNAWWWQQIKSGEFREYYERQYGDRLREAGM